jgi:hypothetical protein
VGPWKEVVVAAEQQLFVVAVVVAEKERPVVVGATKWRESAAGRADNPDPVVVSTVVRGREPAAEDAGTAAASPMRKALEAVVAPVAVAKAAAESRVVVQMTLV